MTIPKSVIDIGENALLPLRNITVYDTLKAEPTFFSASFGKDPLEKVLIVRDT